MANDRQMARFLQRAVGYTMAGLTTEHVLFFCHGTGANGKSTFLEVIGHLFGNYGINIDFDTLLRTHRQGESRDRSRLYKARFVSANETPVNARWNEAVVKELTGGDTIQARRLYEEKMEFKPTHTIWCRGNTQPASHDPSVAFWRRLKLIPFTRQFTDKQRDSGLKDRLIKKELSGILNWALAGCAGWREDRKAKGPNPLSEPESVRRATEEYRTNEDVIGEFIAARCRLGRNEWCATAELYRAFEDWWAETRGDRGRPPSLRSFLEGLRSQAGVVPKSRRVGSRGKRKARGWQGMRLRRRT
jgi:putative DNA primase/helicase